MSKYKILCTCATICFQNLGCETTHSNVETTQFSDVVFISVKPNVVTQVLADIGGSVTSQKPLVTSIAIGITLKQLEQKLPPGARVIRVLPNTPALVKNGASVFCKGTCVTTEDATLTSRL